jgi:diguanylate cyclase (GGDEF)-like protein
MTRAMAGQGDSFRALGRAAQGYLTLVSVGAVAAVGAADLRTDGSHPDLLLLGIVALMCLAGKAFETFAPGHYALQPNYAALVWGCLLLPPWAAPVLALACFAPDLRPREIERYKTFFNIANYTLVGVLVSVVGDSHAVLAMGAAAVAGAVANHALIVVAIALAGEQPLRGTLRQITDGLPLSIGVGLTGAVLAVLWWEGPEWLLLAIGPIGLLFRALWVPMLQHRADTDPKTGLYHSERIREELAAQIAGGGRVAVAMLDLDHLRAINSRAGHLAGDRAIRAVADQLAALAARHGAAGRFGGEEFCLVLPDVDAAHTQALLDEARMQLRKVEFRDAPDLCVTFSAGIAIHPDHGETVDALLSTADAALYDAKAAGRDRVRIAVSAVARETLNVPLATAVHDQPLPAASAAGSRIATAVAGLGARRSGDQLQRTRHDLDDALALIGRMQRGYVKTITTLAQALEDKDPHTAGATERVTALTLRLAEGLDCPERDRQALVLGVAIRDIGRAGVRDAVLLKDGTLDAIEREEVKAHAELSARIIGELELPVAVKQMVRGHHERWDGTGYPDGLSGDAIPLPARILAVAEALDAMLSPRPWRGPLTLKAALAEITAHAGTQFCPYVASAAAAISPPDWGLHLNVDVHSSKTGVDGVHSAHNASSWTDVLTSAG